ncbi:MAG: hypothetical protein ACRDH5_15345, partial [bacterium]
LNKYEANRAAIEQGEALIAKVEIPGVQKSLNEALVRGEKASRAKDSPPPATMRSKGEIGQIGLDDGSWNYRIEKPSSAGRVETEGWDPSKSPTGKTYFSDDPFKTYDLSDRVTAQGAGGDFVMYRVKKDITTLEQPGEFVSREHIAPEVIEKWTGPETGWVPVGGKAPIELAQHLSDASTAAGQIRSLREAKSTILRLQAEQKALVPELLTMQAPARPLFTFPKRNLMRAAIQNPSTPLEHLIHGMTETARHIGFDVRKFVDELPRQPVFLNQFNTEAPRNAKDMNLDTVQIWNQRLHLPKEVARRIENEYIKAKDEVAMEVFLENWNATVSAHLPKNTPFEIREALTEWHRFALEARAPAAVSRT